MFTQLAEASHGVDLEQAASTELSLQTAEQHDSELEQLFDHEDDITHPCDDPETDPLSATVPSSPEYDPGDVPSPRPKSPPCRSPRIGYADVDLLPPRTSPPGSPALSAAEDQPNQLSGEDEGGNGKGQVLAGSLNTNLGKRKIDDVEDVDRAEDPPT